MTYSKEDVKHASELLGLDSNVEINQIIAKTKELSDKYTMNQSPESFEKLSEIHEASQILLEKSTRSTLGESTLNSERKGALFDPKGNNTFVKNNQNLKKKRMKLAFIVSGILLVLIAIAVPIGLSRYRANQYSELEFLMVNFEKFNFEEIGETIDSLPSDYKDMTAIEKQYDLIMREIKMIEDNELSIDYEE